MASAERLQVPVTSSFIFIKYGVLHHAVLTHPDGGPDDFLIQAAADHNPCGWFRPVEVSQQAVPEGVDYNKGW